MGRRFSYLSPHGKITPGSPFARSQDVLADKGAKLRALFSEPVTESEHGYDINVCKPIVGDDTVTDEKFNLKRFGSVEDTSVPKCWSFDLKVVFEEAAFLTSTNKPNLSRALKAVRM